MSTRRPPSVSEPAVTPRVPRWAFPRDAPRDWFAGSVALTSVLDVFTLIIPDNERYYIRTLQRALPRIHDAALRQQVLAFFRQEALHGDAHRRYWTNLRDEGLRLDRFTGAVGALLYRFVEPLLPLRIRVSTVAAIEHVNAYLAHAFLSRGLLADAEPALRRLFQWHFAEEIEHKAVAFDALAAAYPGYATRLCGAAVVFPLFHAVMLAGTVWLLGSRGALFSRQTYADLYRLAISGGLLRDTLHFVGRYLRPSFHPWELDDYDLARAVFARLLADGPAAAVAATAT